MKTTELSSQELSLLLPYQLPSPQHLLELQLPGPLYSPCSHTAPSTAPCQGKPCAPQSQHLLHFPCLDPCALALGFWLEATEPWLAGLLLPQGYRIISRFLSQQCPSAKVTQVVEAELA